MSSGAPSQAFVRCKKCEVRVTRSPVDGKWCHEDDQVVLTGLAFTAHGTTHDHEPDPDFIDVIEAHEKNQAPPPSPPPAKPGGFPFGAIRP